MNKVKDFLVKNYLLTISIVAFVIFGFVDSESLLGLAMGNVTFWTFLIWFILRRKKKQSAPQASTSYESNTNYDTFQLKGIYFENRQPNIKNLEIGQLLKPKYYLYEGEPAIELFDFQGNSIGSVPKELAPRLTQSEAQFIVSRVYAFEDGRVGAEIGFLE